MDKAVTALIALSAIALACVFTHTDSNVIYALITAIGTLGGAVLIGTRRQ